MEECNGPKPRQRSVNTQWLWVCIDLGLERRGQNKRGGGEGGVTEGDILHIVYGISANYRKECKRAWEYFVCSYESDDCWKVSL